MHWKKSVLPVRKLHGSLITELRFAVPPANIFSMLFSPRFAAVFFAKRHFSEATVRSLNSPFPTQTPKSWENWWTSDVISEKWKKFRFGLINNESNSKTLLFLAESERLSWHRRCYHFFDVAQHSYFFCYAKNAFVSQKPFSKIYPIYCLNFWCLVFLIYNPVLF